MIATICSSVNLDCRIAPSESGASLSTYRWSENPGAGHDIESIDAFKRTMLKAKSFAYVPESTSGMHAVGVFRRLGIDEAMMAKAKPVKVPAQVGQLVANGEAELGLLVANLLVSVPGLEFAGPFPGELQHYLVLIAAIGTNAKEAAAGKDLIKHLTTPAAAGVIKAKGMEPVTE